MTTEGTVHVVDDDEAIRDSLTLLLCAAGFTVAAYPSADAFLITASSGPGCVVIDVRMPGMGGLELQEELARRGRRIPVIVMTGHAEVPLAVKAMKAGAVDFVEKPFEEQAMLAAIRRAFSLGLETARAEAEGNEIGGRLAHLTPREREVLDALVAGKPNKIIAYELSISPRTVEIHRARVMEKMEARTLSDLVRMALSVGLGPKPA
ncbi:MAG TPA: response regulator FixJ [Stellaceae bacterium]|jgi:two-component system response regulator FixJ|nr:response regulator FixJ [Stellaceae bacterium]